MNGYHCQKMSLTKQVQILNDVVCISFSANVLRRGMNPSFFPSGIGKWLDRVDSLALDFGKSVQVKKKLWIQKQWLQLKAQDHH